MTEGNRAGTLVDDLDDAHAEAERVHDRNEHAVGEEERERREVEPAPVVGGEAVEDELVAGRDLVEPCERDRHVHREVDCVPGLVAHVPADDHDRAHDDSDEQGGADRGGDHPGIDATQIIVEISSVSGSRSSAA